MSIGLFTRPNVLPECPICHGMGQKVRKITVKHQVKPDTGLNLDVGGESFYLCRTPDCQVAYYSEDGHLTILQNQLTYKIWFKDVASPVPICYCARVTDEEILYHVAIAQCCSTLEEIKNHTGANTGCECLTKNPAGG